MTPVTPLASRPLGGWLRWVCAVAAVATLLVQLAVIYAPTGVGSPPFAHSDKVAHFVVFAAPVFFALCAGMPPAWVIVVMAVHAPVSEVVQALALSGRSGDPWDALADLAGVGGGALLWWLLARRARVSREESSRGQSDSAALID